MMSRSFINHIKENTRSKKLLAFHKIMAESKGFEPSERLWRSHDFQSCSFDQLGQLSVSVKLFDIITDQKEKIKGF